MTSPFTCSPAIRKCSRKKTQVEKKHTSYATYTYNYDPAAGVEFRSSHRRCFKKFCKFHRKTPVLEFFLKNVVSLQACNAIKKETPTQVFFSEIWEILKNNYFEEHLRMTASVQWFMAWCQIGIRTSGSETPLKV